MSRDMIKHIINSVIRKGYWFNNVSFDGCSRLIKYKVFNTTDSFEKIMYILDEEDNYMDIMDEKYIKILKKLSLINGL